MQWIWTNLKLIYLPEVDVRNENTSHAQATFLDLQLISVHDARYLYKKWRSTIKNDFLHFLISKTNMPLQSFLRNLLLTECWCWVQCLTIKIHWKQQGILLESRLILITWSVREKKHFRPIEKDNARVYLRGKINFSFWVIFNLTSPLRCPKGT